MKNKLALVGLSIFTGVSSAAMFPQDSKGEDIWQVEGQFIFANQSNNLPQLWTTDIENFGNALALPPPSPSFGSNFTDAFNNIVAPDPEERWGYGGRLGYVFSSHKNDIQLRYLGINTSEGQSGVTFANLSGKSNAPYDNDQSFSFNAAELMFGNYYHPTKRLTLRASYGIAFADIHEDSTTHFDSTQGGQVSQTIIRYKTSFVGAGPKALLDADFGIYPTLSVVGNMGLALLYGESESVNELSTVSASSASIATNSSDNRVSPAVDAKLGFRYGYTATDDFTVNVEAGYQLAAYLNAMQDDDTSANIQGALTLFYDQEGDYVYSGPYINIGVDFM